MALSVPLESYLNASEHQFNLSFAEVLLLRDYCRTSGTMFCSTMGGCESIRDLQESKYLGAEATEFPFVESLFSISKIFSAFDKVYLNDKKKLNNYKFFINIGSKNGIEMLLDANEIKIPEFLNKRNLVFTFDRIKLARDFFLLKTNKINLNKYEDQLNKEISEAVKVINKEGFSCCISGGINKTSFKKLFESINNIEFIKTGLFTVKISELSFDQFSRVIKTCQSNEAKLLNLMLDVLNNKIDYLNERIVSINDDINEKL